MTIHTRLVACLAFAALVATGLAAAPDVHADNPCATVTHTSLDGVVRDADGDGRLECLPGESHIVREDLAEASEGRSPTLMTAFMTLADFQLADEESPLRGEWADKCGDLPTSSAFRPQESMVPHLLNSHVRAAVEIAQTGSPALGGDFDFVASLGDLADNQQYNEVRLFIDILDGGQDVDTDSGADGYDGVQGNEPEGADGRMSELTDGFPADGSILDIANEPFRAAGLRYTKDGEEVRIPWYSVMGNHDMKVQGTITDAPGWRAFARAWVVGSLKVNDIGPDYQQELCADPALFGDPAFWTKVLAHPQTTNVVPADPDRRLLDKAGWMSEHDVTTGVPTGHGFNEDPADPDPEGATTPSRCRDADGTLLDRACYSFTQGLFHHIVLDTTAAEGLETGNIDEAQWRWLERELVAHSSSYLDTDGSHLFNPDAADKLIVVYTHHTISSTTNIGVPGVDREPFSSSPLGQAVAALQGFHTGDELRDLLLRHPNVILQASGHTHQNKIWAWQDPDLGTGYWEVNTSAIVDYPQQSRTIEIADNGDCTLSIYSTIFDAFTAPDARTLHWTDDDPTPSDGINEDWLASAAREVAFNDPQMTDSIGEPEDRNAELLVDAPAWLCGA